MSLRRSLVATVALAGASAALFAAALPGAPALAAASCAKGSLSLVHAGQLTVATDAPAYPPYFEGNKPANGKGFESAVAYAIAKQLGFSAAQVKWTVEPFDSSYAPGPKSFDFDINEISITSARAEGRRLLDALLHQPAGDRRGEGLQVRSTRRRSPQLRGAKFGVQVGTTSLAAVDGGDQAGARALRLQQLQRRRHRAAPARRRRDRRRPGHRLLPDLAARSRTASDRRPVQRARRRQLGRAADQALEAHRRASITAIAKLRADGDARVDHEPVDAVRRRRARAEVAAVHAVPTSRAARLRPAARGPARAIAVSAVSTVVVIGGAVRRARAQPRLARRSARRSSRGTTSPRLLPPLFSAFWLDVRMFLIVEAIVLALGLLIALVRTLTRAGAATRSA